jgi:hypothetical protein
MIKQKKHRLVQKAILRAGEPPSFYANHSNPTKKNISMGCHKKERLIRRKLRQGTF